MAKTILLGVIVVVNIVFIAVFVKDLLKHRAEIMKEPASLKVLPFSSILIFFFSSFGVSDFAMSTVLYNKLKWVNMKRLVGTLNSQATIPVLAMSLAYITTVEVGVKTLITCIVCQVIGAYIGPRFVVKLPESTIKKVIGVGMIIASTLLLAGQMNLIPSSGTATELYGWKLVVVSMLMFIFGALNNIGIGSFSLTLLTICLFGMNPITAFPIMVSTTALSVPISSIQFIKFDSYSRKITLFASLFGVLGVLMAVFVVHSLDTYMIKWVVIAVLLYTAYTLLAVRGRVAENAGDAAPEISS